jgi:hypothetical protein
MHNVCQLVHHTSQFCDLYRITDHSMSVIQSEYSFNGVNHLKFIFWTQMFRSLSTRGVVNDTTVSVFN